MRTRRRPCPAPLAAAIRAALIAAACMTAPVFAVPDVVPLSTLQGARATRIAGAAGSESGRAVAHAGDINGDGFDDLLIGAPRESVCTNYAYGTCYASAANAGRAYVVFGRNTPLPSSVSLGDSNTAHVFGVTQNGFVGQRVAALGDVNKDGRDDFAVQGPTASVSVVFGATPFPGTIRVTDLNGANGFRISGFENPVGSNSPAYALAGVGDINGDGIDDIGIGVRYALPQSYPQGNAGRTYVVFGRDTGTNPFAATIDVGTLSSSQGARFEGAPDDFSGTSLAALGDVNGDGLDDFAIGAPTGTTHYYGGVSTNPRTYVVFGRQVTPPALPFPAPVSLASLDGTTGFVFRSALANQFNAVQVAGTGDANGDGRDDMLFAHSATGTHLVFGAATFSGVLSSAALNGANGTTFTSTARAAAGANDHDSDGLADIVIGDAASAQGYVVNGRPAFGPTVSLSTIAGPTGYRVTGTGACCSAATRAPRQRDPLQRRRLGDLDGDGAPDVVFGDQFVSGQAGTTYIVYAQPEVGPTPPPPAPATPITLSDFPFDPLGATTTVVFANTGGTTLQVTQTPTIVAPFGAGFTTGGATTVPPHQSRTLTIGCLIGDEQTVTPGTSFTTTMQITTNDSDEAALSYPLRCDPVVTEFDSSPVAGGTIPLSGAQGATVGGALVVRGFNGTLNIHACTSDNAAFAVQSGLFPLTAPPGQDRQVGISCVAPAPGSPPTTGNLVCVDINDIDEPGASYQMTCTGVASAAPRFASTPPPGSTLSISGDSPATAASRLVRVSNTGGAGSTLQVSNCAFAPASGLTVSPASLTIAQGAPAQDLTVTCQLPAPGTTRTDNLLCSTNDPGRTTVAIAVACTRPVAGIARPQDPLTESGDLAGENFGTAAAIADGDGTAVNPEVFVIGAPRPDLGGGEVFVFVRTPSDDAAASAAKDGRFALAKGSSPTAVLSVNGGNIGDKFGRSVAVSRDGSMIVVGAPGRDVGGADTGAAYVFRRPPGGWVSVTTSDPGVTLLQPTPGAGMAAGAFGEAVAIGQDMRIAVGAPDSDRGQFTDAGLAYVFEPQGNGWTQEHEILPALPDTGAAFGAAVAMSDGLLAIGSPSENEGTSEEEGAVYTYAPTDASLGPPTRTVRLAGGIGDKFGSSIAITDRMVVVGAMSDDIGTDEGTGSATIFMRGAGGALVETTQLEPPSEDFQGAGSSVSTNGNTVVLGAPLADASFVNAGRAYVFELPASLPARLTPASALENIAGVANDAFGQAVVIGRRHLLVGVPLDEAPAVSRDGAKQAERNDGRVDPYLLDAIFRSGVE